MRLASCLAIAAIVALGGIVSCGGDDSPEDVAETFVEAVKDRDGKKVCDLLAHRDKVLREASVADCEELGDRLERQRKEFEEDSDKEADVDIDGDEADVNYGAQDLKSKVRLLKRDGKWKIDLRPYDIDDGVS